MNNIFKQNNIFQKIQTKVVLSTLNSEEEDKEETTTKKFTQSTLLYIPKTKEQIEERRISTASGHSIISCPSNFAKQKNDKNSELGSKIDSPSQIKCASESAIKVKNSVTKDNKNESEPILNTIFNEKSNLLTDNETTTRRLSVQTGAPAIAFRSKKHLGRYPFERRSSQPIISGNLTTCILNNQTPHMFIKRGQLSGVSPLVGRNNKIDNISSNDTNYILNNKRLFYSTTNQKNNEIAQQRASLIKRVSWFSLKSLQDVMEPLLEINRRRREDSCGGGLLFDSHPNSQLGSVAQLNNEFEPYDLEADTPPIDTISWSNMGKKYK